MFCLTQTRVQAGLLPRSNSESLPPPVGLVDAKNVVVRARKASKASITSPSTPPAAATEVARGTRNRKSLSFSEDDEFKSILMAANEDVFERPTLAPSPFPGHDHDYSDHIFSTPKKRPRPRDKQNAGDDIAIANDATSAIMGDDSEGNLCTQPRSLLDILSPITGGCSNSSPVAIMESQKTFR